MTDVQEMDELPWGAALIPEWWAELTPHHTIDIEEVDEERRRELARIAAIQAQLSGNSSSHGGGGDQASVSDGSFLADTGVGGPYSLPGFKATDGINDASFVGPGNKKWFITSEGHFYDPLEPDVRYTAQQMAQSGYIPPGLEEEFTKGWDRSRSSVSPVDTSMYARTEEIQWQKPDWLKKKLRSTDQGAAIRHGLYSMEGKLEKPKRRFNDDDGSDVVSTSASPSTIPSASPSPIPSGSNSQQKKFTDLFHNKTPQSTLTPTSTSTPTQSPYAKRFGSPLKSPTQNNNTQLTASSWHNKPTRKEVPQPERMLSWKPKKTRDTWIKQPKEQEKKEEEKRPEKEPTKPLWKKPQQSEDKQTSASVTSAPAPASPPPPVASVEIKKEEEEKAATSEIVQKEEEKRPTPAKPQLPPSPKKEQQQSIQTTLNLKPKVQMPTSLQSVAAPAAVSKGAPEEKSTVVETKITRKEEKVTEPAKVEEKEQPAAPKDDSDGASSSSSSSAVSEDASQELESLVSQGLVLKLMAMPDDASRAKELRDKIAPTPENKGEVLVKPNELLLAIANHAQNWKNDAAQKEKVGRLRQVAIIARLVIMKLYGSDSPELKQFEDGLRPAFAT